MGSDFKFLIAGVAFGLSTLFASAAYVGTKHQEAAVRFAELAVEAARINATHDERFAKLCEAYAAWVEHQNYRGEDLMRGHCSTSQPQETQPHE